MTIAVLAVTTTHLFAQTTVLRDEAFEVTLPPGFLPAQPTKAADASGIDYTSQGPGGIARVQHQIFSDEQTPDASQVYESIKSSVKEGMNLDSAVEFTHQGRPALRMTISMPTLNQVMRMECVLVGPRLYRVWYITRTTAELETPAVRAFFDSFRIKGL